MPSAKNKHQTIDEYIDTFPKNVQVLLEKVRQTIRKAAPGTEEVISYQIPAFKWRGRGLVAFAGWKKHVSVYPVPRGDAAFKKEVSRYQTGKGTVQFPLDQPLPLGLIQKIVRFRLKENLERERAKSKKTK
ncbi:MAG: DUF1801 domain-containing protein [candidate division Zixibacteria bacterium]|nr:DUF1801 domain-containing protein [candidate division Zixibacteria bacterium]